MKERDFENSEGRASAELITQCAADITPRHIDFLWPGRLARGKHTAFAGEPGDGKSQLSIYVAATISRGSEWPCREGRASLGNVIIFNAEDGVDDTIVPRLIAAGADRERVHIVNAVLQEDGKGRRTFNLQTDLALLEGKIREIGDVALVIIDPISSYMGKTDSHKNSEVRGALEPLSEMAERMRVAIGSITHFSKAGSNNTNKALHRFIGSIAFVGAPRAAFAVIEDADNEGRMLLLHAKNNMARKPQGLAYRLLQTIVSDNIVASYVHWEDTPVTISADHALGAAAQNTGSRTMKEEAADFLRAILGQGEVAAEEAQQAARRAGITPKPLRSAREALNVKVRREGFGPDAVWRWSLPDTTESRPPIQYGDVGATEDTQAAVSLMPSRPIDAHPRARASIEPEGIYGDENDENQGAVGTTNERVTNGGTDSAVTEIEHSEPTATSASEGMNVPDDVGLPAFLDRVKGNGPSTWQSVPPDRHAPTNGAQQPDAVAATQPQSSVTAIDHYSSGGLMDYVAGVIEEQLEQHEQRRAAAAAAQAAQPLEAAAVDDETSQEAGAAVVDLPAENRPPVAGDGSSDGPMAPEELPEAASRPDRDELLSAIEAILAKMAPDGLSPLQRQGTEEYLAHWAERAQACGWTATEQAKLILKLNGQEVLDITPNQATVRIAGGRKKTLYRYELGIH